MAKLTSKAAPAKANAKIKPEVAGKSKAIKKEKKVAQPKKNLKEQAKKLVATPKASSAVAPNGAPKGDKPLKPQNKKLNIQKKSKPAKNGTPAAIENKKVKKSQPKAINTKGELVSKGNIKKGLDAFKKMLSTAMTDKKSIVDPDFKYCLQISSFKIPKCPERNAKMELPHSLIDDTDDVCLFVRDVVPGRQSDYQPSIDHFRELLDKIGITNIKTIMPVNQLMMDYRQHEMKRKLCNSYDFFLADACIAMRISKALGKHFLDHKKTPVAIRMEENSARNIILRSLRKVTYRQVNKGPTIAIPVAKYNMDDAKVIENIYAAVQNLQEQYPGGWQNVKSIYLRPAKNMQISIPLYVNLSSGDDVPVPEIVGPKEKLIAKKMMNVNKVLPKGMQLSDKGSLTFVQPKQAPTKDMKKVKKSENPPKQKPATKPVKEKAAKAKGPAVTKVDAKPKKAVKEEKILPEVVEGKQKKKAAEEAQLTAEVESLWNEIKQEAGVEGKKVKKGEKKATAATQKEDKSEKKPVVKRKVAKPDAGQKKKQKV